MIHQTEDSAHIAKDTQEKNTRPADGQNHALVHRPPAGNELGSVFLRTPDCGSYPIRPALASDTL